MLGPNTFAFGFFLLGFFYIFFLPLNSDKINCISLSALLQEGGRETVIAPHTLGVSCNKITAGERRALDHCEIEAFLK